MRIQKLTLPEFAFIEGYRHDETDILDGRNVILHVRSSSVLEVFDLDSVVLNEDVLSFKFFNTNIFGVKEELIIALHYSTLDKDLDRELLINNVLKPAAIWYCDYCDWMDEDIKEGGEL